MTRPTLATRAPSAIAYSFAVKPARTSHAATPLPTQSSTALHQHRSQSRPHTVHHASSHAFSTSASNQARLIKRPHRPYTFTQLLTLSDGSTVLHRTTSPAPVYRSTRDVRNSPLWNPSNAKMVNIEEDDSGRLRAFRRRFGRSFDSAAAAAAAASTGGDAAAASGEVASQEQGQQQQQKQGDAKEKQTSKTQEEKSSEVDDGDNLMDLISSYAKDLPNLEPAPKPAGKPKKGKK